MSSREVIASMANNTEITASINEYELKIMNEEFNKDVNGNMPHISDRTHVPSNDVAMIDDTDNDVDFFDNTGIPSGNMDFQCSNNSKRTREEIEESQEGSRSRVWPKIIHVPELSEIVTVEKSSNIDETQSTNIDENNVNNNVNQASLANSKTVIIIKPLSENSRNLINNPFEIVKTMEDSKFGRLNVNKISTNKRKGLIVATVEKSTPAVLSELLAVKRLGNWDVECYIPAHLKYKVGVIWPIGQDTDLGKVKEIISQKYRVNAVDRLKRNIPGQGWLPSNTIKVVFEESELPSEVILGHSYYKVRPYVNLPLQCYRCQRIGHMAKGCRAKIRCMVCSGEHVKEVCNAVEERCANCGGKHKANSKLCSHIKVAAEIEKDRAAHSGVLHDSQSSTSQQSLMGISQKSLPSTTQQSFTVHNRPNAIVRADVHQTMNGTPVHNSNINSYSSILRQGITSGSSGNKMYNHSHNKQMKNVSTQTIFGIEAEETCKCSMSEDFIKKLKAAFMEVLSKVLPNSERDGTEQETIVEEAITGHLSQQKSQDQGKDTVDTASAGEKRYNTRQSTKGDTHQTEQIHEKRSGIEDDSLEDGVISSTDSENSELFETVEKRQVKVNYMKVLNKEQFPSNKLNNIVSNGNFKKKGRNKKRH